MILRVVKIVGFQAIDRNEHTIHPIRIEKSEEDEMNTLSKTNSSSLKMDGWKMIHFLLGFGLFSGDMLVSGRVHLRISPIQKWCFETIKLSC